MAVPIFVAVSGVAIFVVSVVLLLTAPFMLANAFNAFTGVMLTATGVLQISTERSLRDARRNIAAAERSLDRLRRS